MPKGRSKDKVNKWKAKHRQSQSENSRLRRRIKELKASRDGWRRKYNSVRRDLEDGFRVSDARARGHGYRLFLVELCIRMCQYGGMSLRDCRHSLGCVLLVLGLHLRCPSHVSIRNWVLKHGYYGWMKKTSQADCAGEWALIVDESVTIGAERLLLVLGLDLSKWNFERPPCVENVEVLHLEARSQWKGEAVEAVLKQVGKSHTVVQVLSDRGPNLLKASSLSGYLHISDCGHVLAAILERHLAEHEDFKAFCHLVGELRRHWTTSQWAKWRPPKLRGKSRFLNVLPLVKWGQKVLDQDKLLPAEVFQKTEWLRHNSTFVESLNDLRNMASNLFGLLKTKGASAESIQKANALLPQSQYPIVQIVVADMRQYLEKLGSVCSDQTRPLLCCSDIIETVFGKFKCRTNPNAQPGISDLALIIPHFCGKTSATQIKAALENVQTKQVKNWKEQQY